MSFDSILLLSADRSLTVELDMVYLSLNTGLINSVPYVQHEMDLNLKETRAFCGIYINDIVIASEKPDQHVHQLHLVFARLEGLNITLEPTKAFIDFAFL